MMNYEAITITTENAAQNDNEVFAEQSLQQLIAAQDMFSPENAMEILKDYFQIIA